MNSIYKGITITLLALYVSACGSSTPSNNSDKNNTETQNIVNDRDAIPNNNTEDNNTQDILNNRDTSPNNNRENNNTQDIVNNENIVTTDNIATPYENAEDQTINNWLIISNDSKEANITNTYDDETNSRVIYLDAKIKDNDKNSWDTFKFNGIDSNQSNQFIQWSMKFNQIFTISLNISTDKGRRWLKYIPKDTGAGIYGDSIIHGIGSNKTNNKWHTITRDLERDLKRYEPDNNFNQINYITIQGGGYIDNIRSYNKKDTLEIDKSVVVSRPGVVLTFDDSHVNNWQEMQETFKEKGAVVTFFCNRWADYSEKWDITKEEESMLKSFQDNGHEIGFHTVKHLSTKNHKYDNESNKAQAYFDDQIEPGITNMRERGFEPKSFSYPFISGQPAHDELIRQELPHIRAFFAHVTLIDDPSNITIDEIKEELEKLKREKDIGVFLSHWIISDNVEFTRDKYKISKEKLIKIMDMVNELGLEFYTLEEAHNIYMNQ